MGKSTAAEFLHAGGAQIIDTDRLAHELVEPGQPALGEIQDAFGKGITAADGTLRRAELANIVFSDEAARRKLEAILHPRIRGRWLAQIETWRKEQCPLAVVVIPLLFETKAEEHFDKVICVACGENSRRERLRARGWPAAQIEGRIAAQMPVAEKVARSDFVIWTEGEMENHSRQVDSIVQGLKR